MNYVILIASVITATGVITKTLKTAISTLLNDKFEAIDKKFENINDEFEDVRNQLTQTNKELKNNSMSQDKNFLTQCFDDLANGKEVNETTRERIYECMEEYTANGGNSYIHSRFENLRRNGKL